jgi:hypothetical protein
MTDAEAHSVQRRTGRSSFTTDAKHPLPQWPLADVDPERAHVSASEATKTAAAAAAAANDTKRDDAVMQLARALRTAERAHRAYRAELRVGDVEPTDDWSTWYAEYLLGLR